MLWNQAFIFRSQIGANQEVTKGAVPEKKKKKISQKPDLREGSNFYLTFMLKKKSDCIPKLK